MLKNNLLAERKTLSNHLQPRIITDSTLFEFTINYLIACATKSYLTHNFIQYN
ncbi:hypothetical protein TASCI_10096 [Tenacibaculum ascidiaceicola]